MSTAVTTAAPTDELTVLKAIAEHYQAYVDWPTRQEIINITGPIHGLTRMVGLLKQSQWIEIVNRGTEFYHEIRLPVRMRSWFTCYSKITGLGRYLTSEMYYESDRLQEFYEEPWKWHNEYATFLVLNDKDFASFIRIDSEVKTRV